MSIVNAIASPLSQFQLWRKKSTTPEQSAKTTPAMVENDREEDGFTFVGESASERNTVYTQNRNTPWEPPPPPTYQEVSSLSYSPPYLHPHKDTGRTSLPHDTNELMQRQMHADGQVHVPFSGQLQSDTVHIRDSILDVPFTLAPHIVDPLSLDVSFVQCLPSLDMSSFTYDFSFEQRVISTCISSLKLDNRESSHEIDNNRSPEDQIIQQYGREAVVAQDLHDLIGQVSTGHQQDLMSF